jgi:competence ComEA-like helix-hairpin-helix protein
MAWHSAAVNINTATKRADLAQGIGEKRAQDIIDYRTKNGVSRGVDDLEKVPRNRPGHDETDSLIDIDHGKTAIDKPATAPAKTSEHQESRRHEDRGSSQKLRRQERRRHEDGESR